jgi:hypothetical protein
MLTVFLQLLGACFLAGWMFAATDAYKDLGETTSLISLYLLVVKTILDAIPATHGTLLALASWLRRQGTTPRSHADLSERLLEAAQGDSHPLELNDHAQITVDQFHAHLDLELPEDEENDDWDDCLVVLDSEEAFDVQDGDEEEEDEEPEPPVLLLPPTRVAEVDPVDRPVLSSDLTFNPNPLAHRSTVGVDSQSPIAERSRASLGDDLLPPPTFVHTLGSPSKCNDF